MPIRSIVFAICLATLVVPPANTFALPRNERLQNVRTFAFALGDGALDSPTFEKLYNYDLVIVDGEGASAEQIELLHERGVIVLGYLSIGTIERPRSWFRKAKKYRLEFWADWGEWFADTSKRGYRDLISKEVAPAILSKGFDGLFLDNFAIIEDHRKQRSGMFALVKALSELAHAQNGLLFAQNGETVLRPIDPYLDGWNREDVTSTYDFNKRKYKRVRASDRKSIMAALRGVAEKGILTTTADYVKAGDSATETLSVANSCSAGAIPFVSNISLTRIPETPFFCGD